MRDPHYWLGNLELRFCPDNIYVIGRAGIVRAEGDRPRPDQRTCKTRTENQVREVDTIRDRNDASKYPRFWPVSPIRRREYRP